jgi:hypothetical protein
MKGNFTTRKNINRNSSNGEHFLFIFLGDAIFFFLFNWCARYFFRRKHDCTSFLLVLADCHLKRISLEKRVLLKDAKTIQYHRINDKGKRGEANNHFWFGLVWFGLVWFGLLF